MLAVGFDQTGRIGELAEALLAGQRFPEIQDKLLAVVLGSTVVFELVGKYFQFAPGWEDYSYLIIDGEITWIDEQGNFIQSIDPEMTAY